VKEHGITFAFIKASEGSSITDAMFRRNWEWARAHGIRRGAYHFFRPECEAEKQAEQFSRALDPDPGELPPVLDLETLGRLNPNALILRAIEWMQLIKSHLSRLPILYTGSAFWRFTMNNSGVFSSYPLWIAHYTSGPKPLVPNAWSTWTFWQFSQVGKIPGINGNVDLNAFNGTEGELKSLCARRVLALRNESFEART
jgi:lysozyme